MTISNENFKRIFTCNGSQTEFTSNFKIFEDDEVLVTLYTISDGTTEELTLNSDYTVSGAGNSTFTVTTTSTYSSSYKLILSLNASFTQETDLQPGDDLPADTIEEMVDRCVILINQLRETINRCIKVDISNTDSGTISTTSEGVMYWDGSSFSIADTVIDTSDYVGDINRGLDSAKVANPNTGDLYFATDTKINYTCYTNGTWTPNYTLQLASGGTVTVKDSSGTTVSTIDESGNLRIAGTIEQGASF